MNQTFFFLILGTLLIAILFFLLRASGRRSTEQLAAAADASQLESWPEDLGERILGSADWDYVQENASSEVQHLFYAERKELALSWLYEVRRKSQAVMRTHRIRSTMSDNIRIRLELRLLLDYFVLRTSCEFAILIILFSGPRALRRAVRSTSGVTSRIRNLAESLVRVSIVLNHENRA
jgi:hypothetical protein